MAVLPSLPGITAHILINDTPAPEIPDRDEVEITHDDPAIRALQAARTVSSYIESETNQAFSIKVRVCPPYKMQCSKLEFQVFVDDDDSLEFMKMFRIAQRMLKVGMIEIRVYRTNYGKPGGPTEASSKGFLNRNGTEVPEKSLKGISKSHGTSLGNPRKVARGKVFRVDPLDGLDQPLVIFKFMYRSNESLKSLHLIERTPSLSPSPSPTPSRDPSPTPSELEAVRRLRRGKAARVKRERAEEERGRSRARGGGNRPAKRRMREQPVEIDLTGDSSDEEYE